jgi:hypothetical protein
MSCGRCSKTIRIRGEMNFVICTDILEIVYAGIEDVCESFEERVEFLEHQRQHLF